MASRRQNQQEEVRFKVMRLLAENPEMSTRQIADEVGISNGAAYYCLSALIDKGLVKLGNFSANPRKGQYAYLLTPTGIKEKAILTSRFLERKRREYAELRAEIVALEGEVGDLNSEASEPQFGKALRQK